MSSAKIIKGKIASIKNTKKITHAMSLVAASKMKACQKRAMDGRFYFNSASEILNNVIEAGIIDSNSEFFSNNTNSESVGYIFMSTDRGLCGGLNVAMFKEVLSHAKLNKIDFLKSKACVFGAKGLNFCKNNKIPVEIKKSAGDKFHADDVISVATDMIDLYLEGKISKIFVVYNHFVNSMLYKPKIIQALPIKGKGKEDAHKESIDYVCDSDRSSLGLKIISRFLEGLVHQARLENLACEYVSRMIAMKSASDNAQSIADELQLVFNKSRQAAITQEISEIVAGATS
jgi:F-type H+-transporting ATPase subunit gamma